MTVLQVEDGQVSAQDSVASARVPTGRELRDGYLDGIGEVTFGLVCARESSLYLGPLELLRFGPATVTGTAVDWPIVGGITTRAPGGHFRIEAAGGRLTASIDRYRPRLPLPLYAMTQLPVHHLLTRLLLLRARGRDPAAGVAASSSDRRRAAAVDIALCVTLTGLAGSRLRLRTLLGIAAAYQSPSALGIPAHFKNPQGYWTGFSARARVLIVNKSAPDKPTSILAYADPAFKGKAVIANPLFGTTTTEIAALFTLWGDEKAKAFLAGMKRNGVKVATSNGESADFVASGQFTFALVDSDDAANRMAQGKPVEMIYPDQGENEPGCFIVPNAVVLINGGPHPDAGKKLVDYLLSRETERKLAQSDAAQIPLHAGVETPAAVRKIESFKTMQIDYATVARKMQEIQPLLKEWAGL